MYRFRSGGSCESKMGIDRCSDDYCGGGDIHVPRLSTDKKNPDVLRFFIIRSPWISTHVVPVQKKNSCFISFRSDVVPQLQRSNSRTETDT